LFEVITGKVCFVSNPQLNVNGDSTKLLSAILCAALYPNVVKVIPPEKSCAYNWLGAVPQKFRASELQFKTRDDVRVSNALYVMQNVHLE
jgi:ATP-dependent RNA helicase DHX57